MHFILTVIFKKNSYSTLFDDCAEPLRVKRSADLQAILFVNDSLRFGLFFQQTYSKVQQKHCTTIVARHD